MHLLRKVTESIKKHHLLSNGDAVLVAVSGGPDSVALLHILYELREELELHLEVAHLQHGIRGEEAREDARFVAAMANKLELPFHLEEIDLPQMKLNAGKGNLEALARERRYRFFSAVARQRKIEKIATAHTQDDQVETVLMWLLRGAGRKGLGGMSPISRFNPENANSASGLIVIRPLLDASKSEVLQFLKEKQIDYRWDRTNQETRLLRNWIRLKLIPQLKERTDPQLSSRLAQQAQILRDEEVVLEDLARTEFDKVRNAKGLYRDLLLKQNKALQRRILRRWVKERRGHLLGIDLAHVEDLLNLIAVGPPQGRLSIPGGWELVNDYETVRLEKRTRNLKRPCYGYELRAGAELNISEAGVTIRSKRVPRLSFERPDNLLQAAFDIAALPEMLTVRNFRDGDRFCPLGMTGHKKVKELFIEKKVPLSIRSTLPLLSMGEEILWIPGYGRSEFGKVGPETQEVLYLKAVTWDR
ncbi:MAG TPA: tRNA lysidine(34) synthetase TilS [Methylomirabilota bacterium]|nr:tRNA lysidine(34) synthetase TilS [Methylomirabilota bacterium]